MNLELINKLHEKTEIKDGHWLWTGSITSNGGQGQVRYNHSNWIVSRLSLCIYLKLSYIDRTWVACHIDSICEYKNCWNPLHLYVGTQKENIRDSIKLGSHVCISQSSKTHCPSGHEYTLDNTGHYKYNGARYCKICRYNRWLERRKK